MNTAAKEVQAAPTLSQELEVLQPEVAKVLPPQVSPEKFMRIVMTAIAQSPDLRNADRRTLLTACVKCATDGLVPDGREAALVVFNKQVTYMPMVVGILKKVRNSGELLSIGSNVVHEKDTFRYWIDDAGEHITFEPNLATTERGPMLCCYAIAKTKDGGVYIEVMSRSQIEQVKNVSKSGDRGPWGSWYGEMARKTVIRRLSKRLPMSTDLEAVIHRDDELYDLNKGRMDATSGRDAAKKLLGLPVLPDAVDAAAAGEAPAEPEAAAEPEGTPKGTPLPGFDDKKAEKLLRKSKTAEDLENSMSGILTLLNGAQTPLAIEAAYTEMKEGLGQ